MINFKVYNRNLKRLAFLLAITWFGADALQAQQDRYNWRFGLGVGNQYAFGNPYDADSMSSNAILEVDPAFLSYSAFLELSLSQSFGIKLFAQTRPQDYAITNSGLLLSYYFDNDYVFGKRALITPYLSIGAGHGRLPNSYNVPFGGGLKFRVSSRVNINVDFTATSYTERWSENNFDFGRELGGYSSVSVHYNFGEKPQAYNAPKPYVSPYELNEGPEQTSKILTSEINTVVEETLPDSVIGKISEQMTIDTATYGMIDTSAFMKAPKDSMGKANFLNRYGNILKAPKLGDSIKAVNFEPDHMSDNSLERVALSEAGSRSSRDSTLAWLEYEVKQQRLKNELSLLRKAGADSNLNALLRENEMLRQQAQSTNQYNDLKQRITQLESRPEPEAKSSSTTQPSSYNPPVRVESSSPYSNTSSENSSFERNQGTALSGAAIAGGAAVGASEKANVEKLEAKVDTLQRQLINLQKLLLAQNSKPTAGIILQTDTATADSTTIGNKDTLVTDTAAVEKNVAAPKPVMVDSVKEDYITANELSALSKDLAKTQREVDSLKNYRREEPVPVVPPKPIEKTFFETSGKTEVFFDIGSSTLSDKSRQMLDDMIKYAKNKPEASFIVKAFTDKTGSVAINKALADKRAKAVQEYIIAQGIAAERLNVMGIGPDQSLTSGSQKYGRRVEVILN